jgi:hypothetical protein
MNAAALNDGMQKGLIVMVVLQFAIGFIVALGVLMVLASILSLWGGVGPRGAGALVNARDSDRRLDESARR